MSHPHAKVVDHPFGKGVVASAPIPKGELIATFDGQIYYGVTVDDYPEGVPDYLISFGTDRARHSNGIAHLLNHSCEPNCGVRGLFDLVTMRDVEEGEELCWDYDMSEDSDWWLECKCGSETCRKEIRGFRHLPEEKRKEYRGYISDWLVAAYQLEPGTEEVEIA
ncbi:MAG: SET domain-containing protein-lysine N-methyltransferase [Verrucomicrobiales bacterium]|nr:SET domain-containing protein-lysine N-methyltransferase [Verrucomicrobiales bacterium]